MTHLRLRLTSDGTKKGTLVTDMATGAILPISKLALACDWNDPHGNGLVTAEVTVLLNDVQFTGDARLSIQLLSALVSQEPPTPPRPALDAPGSGRAATVDALLQAPPAGPPRRASLPPEHPGATLAGPPPAAGETMLAALSLANEEMCPFGHLGVEPAGRPEAPDAQRCLTCGEVFVRGPGNLARRVGQ